ncbi:MAG: MinD/ParA family protein [Methanospirillum sp.]
MQIITAHSFRGGTGKTNIIANLSYALAIRGKRVGILDADTAHPSLHIVFGLGDRQPAPTFAELLLGQCNEEDVIHDVSAMYGFQDQLYLIPSNLDEKIIDQLLKLKKFNFNRIVNLIDSIGKEKHLDYLLIDTKPELDDRVLLYFFKTNIALVVTRHDEADIRGTKELLKIITRIPGYQIFLVPNMIVEEMAQEKTAIIEQEFEKYLGPRVCVTHPIPYSTVLSTVHAPHIDQLFIKKYPQDIFSTAIFQLAGNLMTSKNSS